MLKFRPHFILNQKAYSKSFPFMTADAKPFLVRLTLDLNSGLPVNVILINSTVSAHQVGANLVIEGQTLSCDAIVFPQGNNNPDAVAFVTFFYPGALHHLPDHHIQNRAINRTPFLPLSKELASQVKDGEWIYCELDHQTQTIKAVSSRKRKGEAGDTILLKHGERSSTFETLYQGGVVVFNYIFLNETPH